jgi:RNA polymerase primary sigma factor
MDTPRRRDTGLLRAAQKGERRARERIVSDHLRIVRSLAARYRELGLPFDDLVQEGSLGLLDAIDGYDAERGIDFEAYARFRVRRAIRNALTEKSRLIRLPKQIVERRRVIERAEATLTAARGRSPTPCELGEATGLSRAAVVETRSIAAGMVSLDQPVLPDGSTLETVVADASAVDPEIDAVEHMQAQLVDEAVADLPPRQREIVSRHFGIGCTPEEIAEVASALHLSQQRTRTIERDALYALRDRLELDRQASVAATRGRHRGDGRVIPQALPGAAGSRVSAVRPSRLAERRRARGAEGSTQAKEIR